MVSKLVSAEKIFAQFECLLTLSCLRDSLQLQHSTNLNIQRSQSTHRFNNGGLNCLDNNRDQDTNQIGDEVVEDESVEYGETRGPLSNDSSMPVQYDTNLAIDSDDSKLKIL